MDVMGVTLEQPTNGSMRTTLRIRLAHLIKHMAMTTELGAVLR